MKTGKKCAVFLAGAAAGVILLSGIYHRIALHTEEKKLDEFQTGIKCALEDKSIYAYLRGNQEAEDTIVYLQGLGAGDASVSTLPMFAGLEESCRIVLVDRAGCGRSSDTREERTVANIVEEYRTVLEQTGQRGPYVLMAHSIAGMYAEYWASLYPEEVRAIIYLDATPAEAYLEEGEPSWQILLFPKLENLLCNTGLQRFVVSEETLIGADEKDIYTQEEEQLCKYLMYRNTYSRATYSELKNYYKNAGEVMEKRNIETIPRLYLAADRYHGAYYEDIYREQLKEQYKNDETKIQEKRDQAAQNLKERLDIVSGDGKVEIQYISGPHTLYEYAPEEIAEAVKAFLDK